MKAEVEVPALEVVLIELRQFPEAIELALEATAGRPERALRVLFGDTARSWERFSPKFHVLKVFELGVGPCPVVVSLFIALGGVGEPRPRRPLVQAGELSSTLLARPAAEVGGGALRPMMRLVTLLAVADMGCA